MEFFNRTVTWAFDLLLAPFSFLAPVWGLVILSTVAGIIMLLVYGKISNQAAIKRVKKSIAAGIYESVLFRNDLRVSLKAQAGMFWGGMKYFGLAVPPIIILAIPTLIILAQLNLRYGYRALKTGEQTIVSVEVTNDSALFEAELQNPENLKATPPLRNLDERTVSWRINGTPADLNIKVGSGILRQRLYSNETVNKIPTESYASPWWQFFYPGGSIPTDLKDVVKRVSVSYPEQDLRLFGMSLHWLVIFAIVSIGAGLVGSKYLGVEI